MVQLAAESEPRENRLEGRVQEVDSGKELRFSSAKELVSFLEHRFYLIFGASAPELDELSEGSASEGEEI